MHKKHLFSIKHKKIFFDKCSGIIYKKAQQLYAFLKKKKKKKAYNLISLTKNVEFNLQSSLFDRDEGT